MSEWKTIDSAPRDGTLVLLADNEYIETGYCDDSPSLGNYGPWRWGLTVQPTHWMPLPPPPKPEHEK